MHVLLTPSKFEVMFTPVPCFIYSHPRKLLILPNKLRYYGCIVFTHFFKVSFTQCRNIVYANCKSKFYVHYMNKFYSQYMCKYYSLFCVIMGASFYSTFCANFTQDVLQCRCALWFYWRSSRCHNWLYGSPLCVHV